MGLFEKLFPKQAERQVMANQTFQLLNGYTPVFHTWGGKIYESELVRASIDARSRHVSKLQVSIQGSAKPKLQAKLNHGPNEWQTWGQFLYRTNTILDVQGTCFIVPVIDQYGETSGIYPILPQSFELVQVKGVPFLRFKFERGECSAIEFNKVGVLTKFQYESDFFGENNSALRQVMELIHIQNQAISEGAKNAATFRFMATLSNFANDEDIAKERNRFTREQLENGGGIILFKNTYKDVKQVDSKPFVIDAEQMNIINEKVYSYFGVNKKVLQNEAYGDDWSAFYEGAIEPFSIQLSDVLTKMLFTFNERSYGASIMFTSNRLQYMSNNDKLSVTTNLLDRGIITINQALDIWNLPHVENGDTRIIRGEYYDADEKLKEQ